MRFHDDIQQALRPFLRSSEERCEHIKAVVGDHARWSRPKQNHVCRLPNELLCRIFQLTQANYASESSELYPGRSLSHTCGRFRDIALKIPRLWSTLTDQQSEEESKEYLARARNSPLRIVLRSRPGAGSTQTFLQLVLPLKDRWVEFTVDTTWADDNLDLAKGYDEVLVTFFVDLHEACNGLAFPTLGT